MASMNTVQSNLGVHVFYDEGTERYQADCDNCGWHTRESGAKSWVLTMADQHVQDCPRIKPITPAHADLIANSGRP